ncbi:MAG TPA: hypothetical protein VEC14_14250 [Reyranellaceae bacterium]|nr:hypothetical protein [Reyranellaceae bacterium]
MRKPVLFLALPLALALGACGGGKTDDTAQAFCPQPMTVGDAQRLTRFKPGVAANDPRDVVFEATLNAAGTACERRANEMEIDLKLRIVVQAGPSVSAAPANVPYFVRILDGRGAVVQGQDFVADYRLSATNPRAGSLEELTLRLPFREISEIAAYRVAVGLKPTPQELQYNRRAAQR